MGHVLIVAPDRKQARAILEYARALIAETKLLAPLIVSQTTESIELSTNISIEIASCIGCRAAFPQTRPEASA